MERSFPDHFEGYRFVTNHGFWEERENEHNLAFLISQIKKRGGVKGLPKTNTLRSYVLHICTKNGCEEKHVSSALCKLELIGLGSDLERSSIDLREALASTGEIGFQPLRTVQRIADNLLFCVYKASSLVLAGSASDIYEMVNNFDQRRDQLILAGKTITANKVELLLTEWLSSSAENLLISSKLVSEELLPPGYDVLTEKLERGGLQAARINLMKDFKASMESMYLRWKYKHELREANARLAHLKTLVEDDCVEAKISVDGETDLAPAMYVALRGRLAAKATAKEQPLFGATEQHLLGVAAILTEECRLWWSEEFALRSQTG